MRPPGRLRSALAVLLGRKTTPLQIEAEWLEYKQIFGDMLQRFSAQLARDAKAERKRIKQTYLRDPTHREPPQGQPSAKDEVRRRAAAHLGLVRTGTGTVDVPDEVVAGAEDSP